MRQLSERYRLDRVVGRGGMAAVWRAHDLVLNRTVAIKVLSPDHAGDPGLVEAIHREARSSARLSHPHIATVHDYGEAPRRDERVPFVVMEFVKGDTLADRIAERGPLDWREAVTVCAQVAEALAAAHDAGVVHRDIKPGNVMLASDGVKVVDFGIAALAGREATDATGRVWGTPGYIPPEQFRNGTALPTGDVYALGLLLYECLAGSPASPATDIPAARRHRVPPLPPSPERPPAVDAVYRRCVAYDPQDRPTAGAVGDALVEAVGNGAVTRPAVPAGPASRTAVATRPQWRQGRYRRLAALVSAPVAVAAGVLIAQLPDSSSHGDTAQAGIPGAAPGCAAEYVSNRRTDGSFTARLTMINTGGRLPDWSLQFAVPDGYRITEADLAWAQRRRTVMVTAPEALPPEGTATISLQGRFAPESDGAPGGFAVNGVACERAISRIRTSASASVTVAPQRTERTARRTGGHTKHTSSRSQDGADTMSPTAPPPAVASPSPSAHRDPSPNRSSSSSPSPTSTRPSTSPVASQPATTAPEPTRSIEPPQSAGPTRSNVPTGSTGPIPTGDADPTTPASSVPAASRPRAQAVRPPA
jgi:hypothetical protein